MKIKNEIIIGAVPYKIIQCSYPSEENHNVDGQILYHTQEIRIKNDITDEYKENVFIHEVMHGIFDFIGEAQNEELITRISNALYQVIKCNKDIF